MMPPERLPGPIIQNMHIDEVDPGGAGLPDDDVIIGDDDDGLDMDNWRNYTVATDAWEEFKVGNTYRNMYYRPRPRTGRQSTAKFYTHPPGHRGTCIRSLRYHEEIGPVLSITTHGAYNRDFVTLEVPQLDDAQSVNARESIFVNCATDGQRWLERPPSAAAPAQRYVESNFAPAKYY